MSTEARTLSGNFRRPRPTGKPENLHPCGFTTVFPVFPAQIRNIGIARESALAEGGKHGSRNFYLFFGKNGKTGKKPTTMRALVFPVGMSLPERPETYWRGRQ